MKMFVWYSEYLKAYASGTIVVIANNEEEARLKVLGKFKEDMQERYSYLFSSYDEKEEINRLENVLASDISKEPMIKEVLFITGSE